LMEFIIGSGGESCLMRGVGLTTVIRENFYILPRVFAAIFHP
jgi:hypothetical protein